jgi:hypothetical protein
MADLTRERIDPYPHAPECGSRWPTSTPSPCDCGATSQSAAFEAGRKEADYPEDGPRKLYELTQRWNSNPDRRWDGLSGRGKRDFTKAFRSAFGAGRKWNQAAFLTYDGEGVCPWCSALQGSEDGRAGGDTDHYARCPYVSASVTRICDARAEGKEAGRKEADARAMAVVEAAIESVRLAPDLMTIMRGELIAQGFITKDGARRG